MFLPLELTLRPSRISLTVSLAGFALAAGGVLLADLPVWGKAVAALALLAGGALAWRQRHGMAHGVRVSQSGQMVILLDDWQAANIKGQAVVLPWLVKLNVVLENGRVKTLNLWPDSTDADGFRKLRVWLKWGLRQTD